MKEQIKYLKVVGVIPIDDHSTRIEVLDGREIEIEVQKEIQEIFISAKKEEQYLIERLTLIRFSNGYPHYRTSHEIALIPHSPVGWPQIKYLTKEWQ